MNRPIHFEIICDDVERAVKFYRDVFGWEINKWGSEMEEYWLASTGKDGTHGIDGALMPNTDSATQRVVNTIAVGSLDEALAKVQSAGGKVVSPTMQIPGVGSFAYCADIEGIMFGVLEPVMP